jgi:rhamnogalacturonan endolyase
MENLDRGLVAVRDGNRYLVSWRLLGTDPEDIGFNIYRGAEKLNPSPITDVTNYNDNGAPSNSAYTVRPMVNGQEGEPSKPALLINGYLEIPLRPQGSNTPNDASAGDLDGDGMYEIVVKTEDSPRDNSQSGFTGHTKLEAYKLDGTFMWRIDLGINIREGAHYTQFMVYDLDGDGRSEVACKTADGTVDGQGTVIGDADADYRNSGGYVMEGPEFLTVFDGLTGRALETTDYIVPRGNTCDWGDPNCEVYANRVDRFLACVAYIDGMRPSLIMCRGYYTRTVLAAWNWRGGSLTHLWTFDSDAEGRQWAGQGNHGISVGDVDGDGRDEIIYGAMAVDDDGSGLWTSGLGHGDAMHVSDLDPARPGLEIYGIHEGDNNPGAAMLDGGTGEIIWQTSNSDAGRGLAADVVADHIGAECWGGPGGLRTARGQSIGGNTPSSTNFAIWWDGDLLRELLNSNRIDKHNGSRLLTANDCSANNGTKSTPALSADIFGDWREEVIFRTNDGRALRIYSTSIPTRYRFNTLMHDPMYRLGIAWQNVAYNQPPHVGFYLGEGMDYPRQGPDIVTDPGEIGTVSPLRNSGSAVKGRGIISIMDGEPVNLPAGVKDGRSLMVRDMKGRFVREMGIGNGPVSAGTGPLPDGIYLFVEKEQD